MKALILYDDLAVVANATVLLDLLSPSSDVALDWSVKSYPFDQLQQANTTEVALGEAADADLIAVAVNRPGPLPPWVASWLESWAVHRRIQDPDFIVLCGRGTAGRAHSAVHELRRFASRHGLSCVCEDNPSQNDESVSFMPSDLEFMEPYG